MIQTLQEDKKIVTEYWVSLPHDNFSDDVIQKLESLPCLTEVELELEINPDYNKIELSNIELI